MLTPADVSDLVGPEVLARGVAYATAGHVLTTARNRAGTSIVGHVRGSGGKEYVAVVEMSGPGDDAAPVAGRCSCPVRVDCKHVAAVLLVASGAVTPTGTDGGAPGQGAAEWETTFAGFIGQGHPVPGSDTRHVPGGARQRVPEEIGLQLELLTTTPRTGTRWTAGDPNRGPRVRLGMRPVVRGARGRWVRTGVSWDAVRYLNYRGVDHPDEHVDVLKALRGLAGATDDAVPGTPSRWVHADVLPSAALWALLDEARRVGLPVVCADKAQTPVVLPHAPPTTRLVVVRTATGLDVHVDVVPAGTDEPLERTSIAMLGDPVTGIVTWSGTAAPSKESRIELARFRTPPQDPARSLLARAEPLHVPVADERRFLAHVVPALDETVDAVHLDPRVHLPERPRPHLWLDVTHLPGDRARLRWRWRYDSDTPEEQIPDFAVGSVLAHPMRDQAAETAILDQVSASSPRLQRLRRAHTGRRPRPGARGREIFAQAAEGLGDEELQGIETAELFTEELPVLHALADTVPGFDVLVDGDVAGATYRLETDVEVSVRTSTLPDTRDWFDLAILVRVAGQVVPLATIFTALALGRTKILLVDKTYFSLDDERFLRLRDLIDEAKGLQDTMGATLRVNRYQAGLFEELESLGIVDAQADAWRASLGALADGARPVRVEPPSGLRAELRAYQQEGFEWLAFLHGNRLGGVLADDMGLGKTLQTLALVQHVVEQHDPGAGPRTPFLVVAPTSVVENWAAEARRFTPGLVVRTVTGTRARRGEPLAASVAGADLVVTSYALLRLDVAEYEAVAWAGLVLDEAQFVKNHRSVVYRCARRLDVPFKLALTGTPLENTLMELWSILSVVSPGLFPSPVRFAEYYARPVEKERSSPRLAQLRRRVAPFVLRRTKEDVAPELPVKQEQVLEVTLSSRHRELYDRYLQRERTKVLGLVEEFGEHRFEVLRSLTVLRQAALDVSLVDDEHVSVPSSKLEVLFEMLDDVLAEGHTVLVFSQFTRFLGRVRDHLEARGVDHSYLDGRTRRRAEAIERFTSGETKVFLISLKAGGFGLNLTAADYCFLLDPWWNPAAEAQAVDRAHRIGQDRTVMVYRMVAADTVEEKVMALKAAKSELVGSVLDGSGAAGGAGLTAADVRLLLG
ncbi:DEAD/DEAH box helicase [Sanguibacter suaedae]|uniref:SWIM zinc finger family protein n=1 Tax=Sanguibacter suaedae TaxID=2795737 RepID=A0A934I9U3_9MICO|nr:SNF2-related protein [Sanguibacter suaedae]MBI9114008.1 SWIM zinc finger family protein [Sanguibacter suaedae]